MSRILSVIYGSISYALFLIAFLYLIGFVGDLFVPKSVDTGAGAPVIMALLINLALISLFGIQHSIMAREGFKRWWTKYVPEPIERSTFVLMTVVVLTIMFTFWRPMPAVVWEAEGALAALLWVGFATGWLIVLASNLSIDHFDLSGLRQVFLHLKSKDYTPLPFVVRHLYRFVRHPLYLGFIIAFWSTPRMTVGHLLLAAGFTIYILIAIRIEERDLVNFHGRAYLSYQDKVPMLVPRPGQSVPDSGRPERPVQPT